jgi:hypothetical protein
MSNQELPYSPPKVAELGDVETLTGNLATDNVTDVPQGDDQQPNEGVSG